MCADGKKNDFLSLVVNCFLRPFFEVSYGIGFFKLLSAPTESRLWRKHLFSASKRNDSWLLDTIDQW